MPRARRRHGSGLAVWGTGREDGPILVRCNDEAARLLGVTVEQLQALVADLEPATTHADGSKVWRVADLAALLQPQEPAEAR